MVADIIEPVKMELKFGLLACRSELQMAVQHWFLLEALQVNCEWIKSGDDVKLYFIYEIQEYLLGEILQLDNPPDYPKENLDQNVNNGVRVLQIGLALHYIKIEKPKFAEIIISD